MDVCDGIGAPGDISTYILVGLGTPTGGGGGGEPGSGDFVMATTGISGPSGANDDMEMS